MTQDVFENKEVRFVFTSLAAAAEALGVVMTDARRTRKFYTITGIDPNWILKNGMTLSGQVDDITGQVSEVDGAVRQGS